MKKILFILTILCLWKPAAYSAGFPSFLGYPFAYIKQTNVK